MGSSAQALAPAVSAPAFGSHGQRDNISSNDAQPEAMEELCAAESLVLQGRASEALEAYTAFVLSPLPREPVQHERTRTAKEAAIVRAAQLLCENDGLALADFVRRLQPAWPQFARAKSAKLIKDLLSRFDSMPAAASTSEPELPHLQGQQELLAGLIDWCAKDQRTFLRQSLQLRLAELHLQRRQFGECLRLCDELVVHFRRLDDKLSLVHAHLLVSRAFFALKNVGKSRAALTAARTHANAIYCPPELLGRLDLQTGLLHAEDTDWSPALSYFVEALDNFVLGGPHPLGTRAIKYQLLCKIMLHQAGKTKPAASGTRPHVPNDQSPHTLTDELRALCQSKNARGYRPLDERNVQAMLVIGAAYEARSIRALERALDGYPDALGYDPIIQTHFALLYDRLLQQNILKIIAPYQRVALRTICTQLGLAHMDRAVEGKLAQMILDGAVSGIIDQHAGLLIQFPTTRTEPDASFSQCSLVLDNLGKSVQALRLLHSGQSD